MWRWVPVIGWRRIRGRSRGGLILVDETLARKEQIVKGATIVKILETILFRSDQSTIVTNIVRLRVDNRGSSLPCQSRSYEPPRSINNLEVLY